MKKLLLTMLFIFSFALFSTAQNKNVALYRAIENNDKAKVAQLLKEKANPNYIESSSPWMQMSMLMTAVTNDNIDIAKLLISYKANVNWKDAFQKTALMYAAIKGNKEMVVLLLDNGADINTKDNLGNTVLSEAKKSSNEELVKYIEERQKT